MISKDNIKYYIFIIFISILMFKAIDSPYIFLSEINNLFRFLRPFLLSIFMCLLINPFVMYIERLTNIPRIFNILISYTLFFLLFGCGLYLLIPSLTHTLNIIINEIPNYIIDFDLLLNKYISKTDLFNNITPSLQKNLDSILNNLMEIVNKTASDVLIYILSLTSLLFNLIIGIILSIYILYDKEKIITKLKNLLYATFSIKKSNEIIDFFNIINKIFYHYVVGKFIDSLIIGVITFIGFEFILNIKSSLFLSFIIFLTNMIPYFGPFVGAVFPILMTLIYNPIKAFWVAIFLLIIQQIDGNIIGPKVMGDYVGLSPLWIISAVLVGGSLFGFIGVFLSVPIAAILKIYIDKYIDKNINVKDSK